MAILTRLQIIRALYSEAMANGTADGYVYKPFDPDDLPAPHGETASTEHGPLGGGDTHVRRTDGSTTNEDNAPPELPWQRENDLLASLNAPVRQQSQRKLGATNENSALDHRIAAIGDKNTNKRAQWYVQLYEIKRLINDWLAGGGSPNAVNPGPWLEDPTYLTPDMYTYMDIDGDGYEGFTSTWNDTGFEVETRDEAINRLIWVTTYWLGGDNSFRLYIYDYWRELGIIPWDTDPDGD
jgi:hypothetical protein